jgi:hypothetical protein
MPGSTATDEPRTSRWIAACCLTIVAALVLGVGLATGLIFRHVVQTVPLWIAAGLSLRRSRAAACVAAPCFLFWLALMGIIWLFLLGVATLVHGHFSPIEIAMTICVGGASALGIGWAVRVWRRVPVPVAASLFVLGAMLQWICFRLSFLPAFVSR